MLRNCYEDPLYSFDKPRKNSKKTPMFLVLFASFEAKIYT